MFLLLTVCLLTLVFSQVEQWGQIEFKFIGPNENEINNPFSDVEFISIFTQLETGTEIGPINGFYDGNSTYKIRFMPTQLGEWKYYTQSNIASLNGLSGTISCVSPTGNNHGPIIVNKNIPNTFIHIDGTSHFNTGTTSYAWIHEPFDVEDNSLQTLKMIGSNNTFKKLRMLIFPKWYVYTHSEPIYYPYIGIPTNDWDFTRFNVTFWQHLDELISKVHNSYNIIVELILFHPYDGGHWGFDCMGSPDRNPYDYNVTNDEFYLKYVISRYSHYRNVWYSMANEFDFVNCKNLSIPEAFPTWDLLFKYLYFTDPFINYKQISIHNGQYLYNHSRPWITHISLQGGYYSSASYFQNKYPPLKPVVWDEVKYEGDLGPNGQLWGNLTAPQMTDRFWLGNSLGGYVGHSETILETNVTDNNDQIMWWNKGNILRGESYIRIQWFYQFMTNTTMHPPFRELISKSLTNDNRVAQLYKSGEYYLVHFGYNSTLYNSDIIIPLTNDTYNMQFIDVWNMKIYNNGSVNGPISLNPSNTPYNVQFIRA